MYGGIGIGIRAERELAAGSGGGNARAGVAASPLRRHGGERVVPNGTSKLARVSRFLEFYRELLKLDA